jgi:hypothetical protein
VAMLADRNVVQKEAGKNLKYNSICVEIRRMWNVKCMIVPVIIADTGMATKVQRKFRKPHQENIQQIHSKRQLHLEHHT